MGQGVTPIPHAVWARGFDPVSGPPPGPRAVDDDAVLDLRAATGTAQRAIVLLSIDVPAGVTVSVESAGASWRSSGPGPQRGRLPVMLGEETTKVRFDLDGASTVTFATLAPADADVLRLLPDPPPPAVAA